MEITKPQGLRISPAGINWIKLSVIYLIVGVAMGLAMGVTQNVTLRPVHAHVNLLGFTTLALAGLIYSIFPKAGESKLAKAHFWLMNLSFPVMLGALTMVILGNTAVIPVLGVAEVAAAAGVLSFAANLFINLKA